MPFPVLGASSIPIPAGQPAGAGGTGHHCLRHHPQPLRLGDRPPSAVHNAVVLEGLAFMAFLTEALNPGATVMQQELLDKHYLRKHGQNAYYGQK